MIFQNAMSFKAKIKHAASTKGITTQQVMQNYLIEAFLAKLAKSNYRGNFVVKGGYLIGGIVGLEMRSTMDLDTTIVGFKLTPDNLTLIAKEILEIPTDESFVFTFDSVAEIRESSDYSGYRLKLRADFEQIHETVTIDVTVGDAITPKEAYFNFDRIFNNDKIGLLSYPIETVLAEKLETILSRGIVTTRARDYYDVYILFMLKLDQIDLRTLKLALENTKNNRQSMFELADYEKILDDIKNSDFQRQLWHKYQKQYSYAKDTSFDNVINTIEQLMFEIFK